jgi:hypothetical protein
MSALLTLAAIVLIAGSSWTLGTLTLSRMAWPELRPYERAALRLTAGLGLTALVVSVATLAGWFSRITAILGVLTAIGIILLIRAAARVRSRHLVPPQRTKAATWVRVTLAAVAICAALACLGAIAPVADDDALAYVIPIARHISEAGAVRVWPDQARSMWPQSQQVLLAYILHLGGDRLGALTALEWLLAFGVMSALARRVCERSEHIGAAMVIAFGAPVVAFQVASAKEDLFLLAASVATGFCLAGSGNLAEMAAAGMFAGIAAGSKYPGLGIAIAAVAWPLVSRRKNRLRSAAVVALCAVASGGLWYGLNLWHYGNPVAPFVFGARGTPLTAAVVREFEDGYGGGRGPLKFLLAPVRIFVQSGLFSGRGNLFNPLVYAGLLGLFAGLSARRSRPLFFASAVLYVGWFFSLQNARLLLPVAAFLAPSAADRLVPFVRRRRSLQILAWGAMAVSLGIVAAVGVVRAERYVYYGAPGFLARQTANYEDIQWMNAHLDRLHDRVASDHKELGYLDVPSVLLDSSYQIEISAAELTDPQRLLEAFRRQGITHLFGSADSFPELHDHLRVIYRNSSSRLGGLHFFRTSPTEATAVFEIVYPNQPPSSIPPIR